MGMPQKGKPSLIGSECSSLGSSKRFFRNGQNPWPVFLINCFALDLLWKEWLSLE
jgi:hypothetical protein